jgi:hypothetical protein
MADERDRPSQVECLQRSFDRSSVFLDAVIAVRGNGRSAETEKIDSDTPVTIFDQWQNVLKRYPGRRDAVKENHDGPGAAVDCDVKDRTTPAPTDHSQHRLSDLTMP